MTKTSEGKTQLQKRIKELEEQLEFKNMLSFVLNDPVPEGETARKKYVSDIALFYQSVFREKLKHFIGLQLEELAQIGRTELSTNVIRANINCFRLIDEWMNAKANEHIGNVEEIRKSLGEDQEFINKMKEDYAQD